MNDMSDARARIEHLPLIGGALCLDFANTTGWRPDPRGAEYVHDYEDLIAWAEHGGALEPGEARKLLRAAKAEPEHAQAVHRRAIALREAVYRVFSGAASGRGAAAADVDLINRSIGDAYQHLRLAPRDGAFAWEWHDAEGALELPLWRVAQSAASLLISPDLRRVRECSGENCDWLFVDESKNHSRRWCDMTTCGNRAKARRNYARRRQAVDRPREKRP